MHPIVVKDAPIGPGEYRLQWEYGVVDSLAQVPDGLAKKASELCPDGWTKVRENRIDRGGMIAPIFIWDVRCAPP